MTPTVEAIPQPAGHAHVPPPRLGMDMITFFNGPFWGYRTFSELTVPGAVSPHVFWDRALDIIAASGIEGVEIAGGFSHYSTALERYASADGFRRALANRALELCSGFYAGMLLDTDGRRDSTAWLRPDRQEAVLDEVARYADFLRESGAGVMVMATPMRKTWNDPEPQFVGPELAGRFADLVNRMGYVARTHGVRLAVHPEAHAMLWLRRDIRLILTLTDPVYVDFCPDTAHITLGGSNPVDIYLEHSERIAITHWKDARGTVSPHVLIDDEISPSHHPMFANIGEGIVDWTGWAQALSRTRYSGWAILELDAAPDPGRAMSDAARFVREHLYPIW